MVCFYWSYNVSDICFASTDTTTVAPRTGNCMFVHACVYSWRCQFRKMSAKLLNGYCSQLNI